MPAFALIVGRRDSLTSSPGEGDIVQQALYKAVKSRGHVFALLYATRFRYSRLVAVLDMQSTAFDSWVLQQLRKNRRSGVEFWWVSGRCTAGVFWSRSRSDRCIFVVMIGQI